MNASGVAAPQKNQTTWENLKRWVHEHDGASIHPALYLEGHVNQGSEEPRDVMERGVVASSAISKGEWLIRLPSACVISGELLDSENRSSASSWLQCVAAYYQATQTTSHKWRPYLNSLPSLHEYETLLQWTDEQVQNFLAGTTVGELVLADRKEQFMTNRYRVAVRPFLRKLGLLSTIDTSPDDSVTDEEWNIFLQVCMCISTRGFHLDNSNVSDKQQGNTSSSGGPFLLPVIDLLNHDPSRKCTTLHRDDATGMFCMVAERDIAAGEEVFHSYGDSLTGAQLLQTFGFVPTNTNGNTFPTTPVVLHKTKHLLAAAESIKKSSIPQAIQNAMASESMGQTDQDDVWDVREIPCRPLSEEDVPDDWLFSRNDSPGGLLSDELITFLVLQFLPSEAYEEIVLADGSVSAWLDRSIMDDVYLRELVCHTLLEAIRRKKAEYVPIEVPGSEGLLNLDSTSTEPLERDQQHLTELLCIKKPSKSMLRAIYGLRVRIEELASLKEVYEETRRLLDNHDDEDSKGSIETPPTKRPKKSTETE